MQASRCEVRIATVMIVVNFLGRLHPADRRADPSLLRRFNPAAAADSEYSRAWVLEDDLFVECDNEPAGDLHRAFGARVAELEASSDRGIKLLLKILAKDEEIFDLPRLPVRKGTVTVNYRVAGLDEHVK